MRDPLLLRSACLAYRTVFGIECEASDTLAKPAAKCNRLPAAVNTGVNTSMHGANMFSILGPTSEHRRTTTGGGMAEHRIGRGTVHYKWDNTLPPAVDINSGDVVHCETEEVSDGQVRPDSPASALAGLNFDRL